MTDGLRPQLLKLARDSVGLTQQQVAEELQVTQVSVSRWESGSRTPEDDQVLRLSELYGVTEDFFSLDERDAGLVAGDLHHRRRRGVKVGDVRRLEAQTNILRIGATRLMEQVVVDPMLDIPNLPIEEHTPAQAAREVRRDWGLPIGPINDLTGLLELAGVLVVLGDFEMGLDGVSMWAGPWPLIHLSRHAPADRRRFTMAHELGHLVLHRDAYDDTRGEREADRFAAEFLMPADQIKPDLMRLTLQKAIALKLEWYASVAALIVRARDVGAIDADDATRLHKQRSARGWTKHEPYSDAFPDEEPSTLNRVEETLLGQGLRAEEVARLKYRRQPPAASEPAVPRLRIV